ncbi:MAG: lysophospholipid acyltransferase family protein [SAR324 cluster bacterium]|nr:lysophospholipid acyltransferase family protein [SAR324 cluster bacterium]
MESTQGNGSTPGSRNAAAPLQVGWRWFCLAVLRVFYRRTEVDGLEHLPRQGPVLLCANHPSAFADAAVVQAACPRPVHPLARSGLFRNPLLRPLLAIMQAIPVYRRQDSGGDTSQNVDSFEKCYQMFAAGEVLLIFPEGASHHQPRLLEMRTGAARLALGALERNGRAPLLLPIGLNFSDVGRFRSSVLVKIDSPVPVQRREGETPQEAAVRITGDIHAALGRVTLNLESWDDLDLLRRLERFFNLRRGKYRRRKLSQRFRSLQKLIDEQNRLRRRAPSLLMDAARRLRQFERLCERFGVRDYHLTVRYTPGLVTRFVMRSLTIILLGLPLAAWGSLNSALPYVLTGLLAVRVAKDRYEYDTAKILLGMLFFGMFWGAQTAAVYTLGGTLAAVLYAASLLPSAAVGLYVRRERERIWDNIKVFFLFLRKKELRDMLEVKRTELEKELAGLVKVALRDSSRE